MNGAEAQRRMRYKGAGVKGIAVNLRSFEDKSFPSFF